MKISTHLVACIALLGWQGNLRAQTIVERGTSEMYRVDSSGKLVYSKDEKGNRLLDFSYVGYHSGERPIPHVPVKITLDPRQGDDTRRIQDALDRLGTLPADKDGFRGTLLLKRGVFRVGGRLIMSHSGTVLRGEGSGQDGTIIVATGYGDPRHQRTLITVASKLDNLETHILHGYIRDPIEPVTSSRQAIVDTYVPVGSHSFTVKSAASYKAGDRILVHRPSTANWIRSIGCDDRLGSRWGKAANARWVKAGETPGFYYQRPNSYSKWCILKNPGESWDGFVRRVPLNEKGLFHWVNRWDPGDYDFYFERRVTGIEGNRVTIDAPIVHSMDQEFGGGAIYHYETPARVMEVGIENLRLISEFAAPTPGYPYGNPEKARRAENHAWNGIQLKSNTENTWVRDVTGNHFGFSLVSAAGKRATVQDCVSLGHASKITGARRYTFMINGQLNLVQRCLTYEGRHEFVTQERTAGPNVFVDCLGLITKSCAGPHHRYSVGTLFDNVKSGQFMESRFRGGGHGWAGTQTCFYNCIAPEFKVKAPPGGISWVIGSGKNDEEGTRVTPASLYYQQVQDRLGKGALDRLATEEQRKHLGKYIWVKERLKDENRSDFTVLVLPVAGQDVARNDVLTKENILAMARKVNDYQLKNPRKNKDRNWIRATYYTGVMALYRATNDEKMLVQAMNWAEKHKWQPGNERAGGNVLTCGQTWLELYALKKDPRMIGPLIKWIDSGNRNTPTGAKVWYLEGGRRYADSLYVGPPTLAMLAQATGNKKYLEYMDNFYWDVYEEILDKEEGLFYRDKRFIGIKTKNGKKIFWSRGNGWVIAGLPRILEHLPKDHPTYPRYLDLLKTMVAAIAPRQGKDGLWRPNLGDAEEFPMKETSGTGFFVYALAWGINNGVLDRETYLPVVHKGWAGLVRSVSEEGKMQWGQLVGDRPVAVKQEHSHEYVTGTFLLAASEVVKLVQQFPAADVPRAASEE